MNKYIFWAVVLMGLLIVVVYNKGFTADLGTLGSQGNALVRNLTGRNQQGNFAPYPTNG